MDRDLNRTKDIDNYLCGNMDPQEYLEFEKRLENDESLRQEVEITRRVIEGIQGAGFKEMLKKIHREHFGGETGD